MRKLLVVLAFVLGVQLSYAQKSTNNELPGRLFLHGKEMFMAKNYVGTVDALREFKKQSKDSHLTGEVDFMILASMYYQGTPGILSEMKAYLEKHPETSHRDQLCFFIGSKHFEEKEWAKALYWLGEADLDYLTEEEQEDYSYRIAFTCLQAERYTEAKRLFGLLMRNGKKYDAPASYYYAYIDFKDGNYKQASSIFRQLQDRAEYKENATFYLMQTAYLNGKYEETIKEGKNYLASYPKTENAPEVYRLLGSSYYKTGDLVSSVINYERYLQAGLTPSREDMYQLADAYYQNNTYKQAVVALKNVASSTDLLGQSGYMLLGQCYLKLGDNTNASMAFEAASRSKFEKTISEDALYNYVLLMNKGSVSALNQSVNSFQRFLTEYPNSRHANEINGLLANTLLQSKNYDDALSIISKLKSPSAEVLRAKQIILAQLGSQEFVNGDYNAALTHLDASIAMGHSYDNMMYTETHMWRGDIYYRQGDYARAIKDYEHYINNMPSSQDNYPLALYNLGYSRFQMKRYEDARTDFGKYVSAEKNTQVATYADALNRIGDIHLYNRQFAEADKYYSQAMSNNSASADYAEFQKAFVKGLQRDYKGKVATLDNMMAKYPSSEYYDDALLEKSKALVMQNKEKEAIPVLENLLRSYSKSNLAPEAGVQVAQLYFNTGNSQKSIDAYKRVISNYPNSDEARLSVQSLEGVYKEINDIGAYASYMNSLGGGYSVSSIRQDSLTYMAAEALYLKNNNQAKSALNNYLRSYPKGLFSGNAHFNLGLMAFESKDNNTALPHFKSAIESNNSKFLDDALIYASGIEFDKKEYAAAYATYEHLDQATVSNDNKGIAQLGMLRCAYLTNKDAEVVSAAKKVLDNGKLSAEVTNEAKFYRAKSLRNLGRNDEAIADFAEVGKDARTEFGAESQFTVAQMYYDQKLYDKAEKQVTAFMKTGTSHQYWMARALFVLSDVYAAKGDYFQARQYVESMQANYKGSEADIASMISERLEALENK